MTSTKIVTRRATLADLVQCCEIYNYYILNTTTALREYPQSLVYLVDRWRRVLEQGLPFLVLVDAEVQHEMLGFFAATAEPTYVAKFPGISFSNYIRPDFRNSGVFDRTALALYQELVQHDTFRGLLGFFNQSNPVINKKLRALASGLDPNAIFFMQNGGLKFGEYIDLGIHYFSKKDLEKILKLREHLWTSLANESQLAY
jgi:L-amino acid N-acyltransferase YncA